MKNLLANSSGKSFITIMVVIAFSALALRFTIDKLIKLSINQNESSAWETLKLISAAFENYAKDNNSAYPVNISALINSQPPYLDKDYIKQSPLMGYIKGYNYNCSRIEAAGYSCSAVPVKCGLTGKNIYNIITGGLLISEECDKKE
ncbi:MAG: hypothetical protein V1650_01875 [Candidatus Omnitrophota bacterium]